MYSIITTFFKWMFLPGQVWEMKEICLFLNFCHNKVKITQVPSSESHITLIHYLCWNLWTEKMILLLGSRAVRRSIPVEGSMFQESKEQGRQQTTAQALVLLCSRYEVNRVTPLWLGSLLIVCHNYFIINSLDAETVPPHEYTVLRTVEFQLRPLCSTVIQIINEKLIVPSYWRQGLKCIIIYTKLSFAFYLGLFLFCQNHKQSRKEK